MFLTNYGLLQFSSRKKKKRMRTDDLELIAIGTATGNILLYSVVKGDLHTQLVSFYVSNNAC